MSCRRVLAAVVPLLSFAAAALAQGAYVHYESPQVRPIAITPDGTRLLAVHTADARLSVFDLAQPSSPKLLAEIPVGIEPVSVRARTNDEAWVVNHTSDSVSVVSLSQGIVTATIRVKDEPCDVVFAGSPVRAYVTASRSNEVRVFDVTTYALVATIPVFGENPRALAASADGTKVFAAFALSGNRTTIVPEDVAPPQPPPTNPALPAPPSAGLIVDATDPAWSSQIKYTVPDNDVVEITTSTNTVSRYFPRVGTHNTGIAVRPGTGDLFVANTDARNLVRFETALRGHLVDHRVSRVAIGNGAVTAFDLNPGVDYGLLPNPTALANAIAQPMDVVFDPSGSHLWIAAFGSDRVAKVDASGNVLARIEIGPASGTQVDAKTKRGPRGLALLASASRLYVLNRLTSTITVVDTSIGAKLQEIPVGAHDPTPAVVRDGRGFLYDTKLSGNGLNSCAVCHYDGDVDLLAWDLGNPGGSMQAVSDPAGLFGVHQMHPMKGPMTTQSLKGLDPAHDPLHWRGDRSDFTQFNPAFDSLLGGSQLAFDDMVAFRDFVETMKLEPNPNQNLDRTLPTSVAGGNPQTGQTTYMTFQFQPLLTCNTCHVSTTGGQAAAIFPGSVLLEPQPFNVPQLRNAYQKTGLNKANGAQSRGGFGFLHDGSKQSVQEFLLSPVFGSIGGNTTQKNNLNAFLMCFDTGTAPAVGFERTVTQANANQAAVNTDVTLLQSQAAAGNVDVIGKGRIDGVFRGLRYLPAQSHYTTDTTGVGPFTWTQLKNKAQAGTATFTLMGVPPGSGLRMGVDRDLDGVLDGDEPAPVPLASFGASTPACAGGLVLGTNTPPTIGNALFAFTCTNVQSSTLALVLVGNQQDLAGTPFFGTNLHVSLASTELLGIDLFGAPSGFGIGPAPIPNNPLLVGAVYHAQVISLAACAPFGIAASQGLTLTVGAP